MTRNRTAHRSMSAILITLAIVASSEAATAAEDRWECCDFLTGCPSNTSAVTVTANRATGTGTFQFDGVVKETKFNVNGLNRNWVWDNALGNMSLFVINHRNHGQYLENALTALKAYAASGKLQADALFKCERR